jgi:chromosome segregation ATPase
MGRPALITYEQVKVVIDALRADGAKPTIDRIWEALHKAGSKGTVHKLAKQYFAELEGTEKAPKSLRLLPPDVQQVILAFADDAAATMREKIAEELLESKREAASLADDNERLTAELDDLHTQLAQAVSDKAAAHGRAEQLANELVAAREEIATERAASERARTALATAELRLEAIGPLEEELRQARTEREERANELKSSLACIRDACARLESRNGELADALEHERQARAIAERERAVLAAVQAERPGNGTKSKKNPAQQEALWQGDGNDINGH